MTFKKLLRILAAAAALASFGVHGAVPLPKYNVDKTKTTV